jgi:hypothetical protein
MFNTQFASFCMFQMQLPGCSLKYEKFLKYNACTDVIPRQKSHWTMCRHLNNEGQEWKTGHSKRRSVTGEGGWKKEVKVNVAEVLPIQEWI